MVARYFGAVENFRGELLQLVAALTSSLLCLSDGLIYTWTSPMIPYLLSDRSHITTTLHEAEWLEILDSVGSFFCLPLTVYVTANYGLKVSLFLTSLIMVISWTATALGNSMVYLFVARFIFGFAGNLALVAVPAYVAEIADKRIRGGLLGATEMMELLGFVIMYSVGPYTPYYTAPLIGVCFTILEMVIFYFMPETPYYLLYKNKPEEAKESLRFFRSNANIDEEAKEISTAMERQVTEGGSVQDFLLGNRKGLLIMTVLCFGQNFCASTVILMNVHLILEAAGSDYMNPSVTAIIFSMMQLVTSVFASLGVDRYGRKLLLISSSLLTGLCLLVLAVYFHLKTLGYETTSLSWIPTVSVILYAVAYKLGLGFIPTILVPEIFPVKFKAFGIAMANAMYVLSAIASLQIYQRFCDVHEYHVPFYIFSAYCFSIIAFVVVVVPETAGKTLEEIQAMMAGKDDILTSKA